MKRVIRRLILKHRLARWAKHLESLQYERDVLTHSETYAVRQINALRVQLMNLDIRARSHA